MGGGFRTWRGNYFQKGVILVLTASQSYSLYTFTSHWRPPFTLVADPLPPSGDSPLLNYACVADDHFRLQHCGMFQSPPARSEEPRKSGTHPRCIRTCIPGYILCTSIVHHLYIQGHIRTASDIASTLHPGTHPNHIRITSESHHNCIPEAKCSKRESPHTRTH